jgi:hypothetical protein
MIRISLSLVQFCFQNEALVRFNFSERKVALCNASAVNNYVQNLLLYAIRSHFNPPEINFQKSTWHLTVRISYQFSLYISDLFHLSHIFRTSDHYCINNLYKSPSPWMWNVFIFLFLYSLVLSKIASSNLIYQRNIH